MRKPLSESLPISAVLALAMNLAAVGPVPTRPISEVNSGENFDVYEKIDAYIEKQMNRLNIPGAALAIVEDDKIAHLRGFGRARPNGEAPSPQTPFFLGSVSKSFTALAVMQLVEAGKIELDAPVQRYLPWFRVADLRASAQITVRHLLNQTSGLPLLPGWITLADFDDRPDACEHQARALASLKLIRPPGSAFEYSNTNYNLLGLIIEAASGGSYEAYIQDHIFAPLEMSHSYAARAKAEQNGLAMGYRYWFAWPVPAPNLPFPRGSVASGQLISSAEDMAHYLIAHLNEGRYGNVQILSPKGIEEMHRSAVKANLMGVMGQYGMGWFNEEYRRTRIIWHDGIVPDFMAYIALLPEERKGILLFFNADQWLMTLALLEVERGVTTLLAGDQPNPVRFGFIQWVLRGLLLIPVLQIVGFFATLRLLRRWRRNVNNRPSRGRKWVLRILLPLIPNLLVALTLLLVCGPLGGFIFLYAPDFSWIALICGTFAVIWIFLRTGLILRTLQKSPSATPLVQPHGSSA
jgi:CubicO group peptidase (beta-lactamase class C family)